MPASISNGSVAAALPPPRTAGGGNKGALIVTVLSAYDLPAREQPINVSLSCLDQTVSSAAPSARHKDRNSFKFSSQEPLTIKAPLADLYRTSATLTVKYRLEEKNLSANIQLNSLKVQETAWLILNLESKDQEGLVGGSTGSDDEIIPPTLRLQVRLEGPLRPEIATLLTLGNAWFGVVDNAQTSATKVIQAMPLHLLPDKKFLLIPAVPVATSIVVISPIVAGILIIGLPLVLPIMVVLGTALVGMAGLLLTLYASTVQGRSQISSVVQPVVQTLLSTSSGQRLVYETGPRPTPVSVARVVVPNEMMGRLFLSLVIDLLGSSSYLLPLVGEGFDVFWAPTQTILIMAMYDQVSPNLKYVAFFEEILPFTDIMPSATCGWLMQFGPQLLNKQIQKQQAAGGVAGRTGASALASANTASLMINSRQ